VSAHQHAGRTLGEVEETHVDGQLLGAVEHHPEGRPTLHAGTEHLITSTSELLVIHGPSPVLNGEEHPPESLLLHLENPPILNVLILGWSEVVPDLIDELSLEAQGRYQVDIVSEVPEKRRKKVLQSLPFIERVAVRHIVSKSLRLDSIDGLDLRRYDRFLVPSDRSGMPGGADARTLAFVLDLNQSKGDLKEDAYVTVELLEEEDLSLFSRVESIISPDLIADVLVASALAPETHEALQKKLRLQQTYVTRVLPLEDNTNIGLHQLRGALRTRNAALLDVLPTTEGTSERSVLPPRVLAVVPAAPQKMRSPHDPEGNLTH
jgi:hypothetical protein